MYTAQQQRRGFFQGEKCVYSFLYQQSAFTETSSEIVEITLPSCSTSSRTVVRVLLGYGRRTDLELSLEKLAFLDELELSTPSRPVRRLCIIEVHLDD